MRLVAFLGIGILVASCGLSGPSAEQPEPSPSEVAQPTPHEEGSDAPSGHPSSRSWTDPAADMWTLKPRAAAPSETNADIREVTVRFEGQELVIDVAFTELRNDELDTPIDAMVRTDGGKVYHAYLAWVGGSSRKAYPNLDNHSGDLNCTAATGAVDLAHGTASMRVPRSCLGVPRWVQVYLASSVVHDSGSTAGYVVDSGSSADLPSSAAERVYGPPVYATNPPVPTHDGPSEIDVPDPQGDVRSVQGETQGDLVGLHVEHTASAIRLVYRVARLERSAPDQGPWYRVAADLRTEAGLWSVEMESQGPLGVRPPKLTGRSLDDHVRCGGLDDSVDFVSGVVELTVPRWCLKDPKWVQVDAFIGTWHDNGAWTLEYANHTGVPRGAAFTRRVFAP